MNAFAPKQIRALRRKLARCHVQTREVDGRTLDYIEGWFAIAEANAIFGFDGWDREMTHFERLYERSRNDRTCCGYLARVRIRVHAGARTVVREGTGWGNATAANLGEAHERALKAAETDATKRALATFGNRFGLGLYDKEQAGVTPKEPAPHRKEFAIMTPDGSLFANKLSGEAFCVGLRQLIEKAESLAELSGLESHNADAVSRLRLQRPTLKTTKQTHYADILFRLIEEKRQAFSGALNTFRPTDLDVVRTTAATTAGKPLRQVSPHDVLEENGVSSPQQAEVLPETRADSSAPANFPKAAETRNALPPLKPSRIALGPRIDKSVLSINTERRLRDKDHLKYVGTLPCLVCGRQPSHAHHLKFAQSPGLALKVSDEFTVPLCAIHHDELHRSGSESDWWKVKLIEPLEIASSLWRQTASSA